MSGKIKKFSIVRFALLWLAVTHPCVAQSVALRDGAVQVPEVQMASHLVKRVDPASLYVHQEMEARVSGTVVLRALIGKSGRVEGLKVLSGPPMLRPAVLKAVRQWIYTPWLVNGHPVAVETRITVPFQNF